VALGRECLALSYHSLHLFCFQLLFCFFLYLFGPFFSLDLAFKSLGLGRDEPLGKVAWLKRYTFDFFFDCNNLKLSSSFDLFRLFIHGIFSFLCFGPDYMTYDKSTINGKIMNMY
jgi:hypothetical protein